MKIASRARVLLGAAALTGAVFATGSAFTATGIERTAPATQFLGGTVAQSVTGATLSTLDYTFFDTTNTEVTAITLTFADSNADGATVSLTPSGTGPGTFTCGDVSGTTSICSFVPATAEDGYAGLTGISITVGNTSA